MEIKILTNYDSELYCVECKQKIRFLEKFGVIYDCDSRGSFELLYHTDCLPESHEDDIYLTNE